MQAKINENAVSHLLPSSLDRDLQDISQNYGELTYSDIMKLGSKYKSLNSSQMKDIRNLQRDYENSMEDGYDSEAEKFANKLISRIKEIIK